MSLEMPVGQVTTPRSPLPLVVMICGIVAAIVSNTASAAPPGDEAPSLKVRYSANTLDSDRGAKMLYNRLVHAAEQVCPAAFGGSPFVSRSVQQCREQAVARAVHQINNSRLAAVYSATTRRG